MSTTKLKIIITTGVFASIFIISFLAWPSTIHPSNATISMRLCPGVYLDQEQSDCGNANPQSSEKKYFEGFRYMSEVYGITENSQIDQSKFSASEAVRGSLVLAIIVTGITYFGLYLSYLLKVNRRK